MRRYGRQNSRGEYRKAIEMIVMAEVGTGLERGHFPEIMAIIELEVQATVDPGQACTNRDRIHCYECREYDLFAKDCPTSREEKEIEQLQQIFNMGDEQTSITPPNMQDNFSRTSSEENLRAGHLNL